MSKKIHTLLIANRGEIACRIIRTCKRLGIKTVAVFTPSDSNALHSKRADVRVAITSYLDGDEILSVAKRTGADAIHPGYGFLSENAGFAAKVEKSSLTFIGPRSKSISSLGDKLAAKALAHSLKVPVSPSFHWRGESPVVIEKWAKKVGFPLMIKASSGGGGRGLRKVSSTKELSSALVSAQREAEKFFSSGSIFIEKLISPARHVEVQMLGDKSGKVIALSDRDCTMQRRNQKIIEEAPATLSAVLRKKLHKAAVQLGEAVKYTNAGTAEFLVQGEEFYFLEVNSRLQVEHPITEAVTGLDLVEIQIRLAEGELLSSLIPSKEILQSAAGHAIEARICAEIPEEEFLPSSGTLEQFSISEHLDVRIDSGVVAGDTISPEYDSLIAKLIVHGIDREEAREKMLLALQNLSLTGLRTNLNYLLRLLRSKTFQKNEHNLHSAVSLLPTSKEKAQERQSAAQAFMSQTKRATLSSEWRGGFRLISSPLKQELLVNGEQVFAEQTDKETFSTLLSKEWIRTAEGIFHITRPQQTKSNGAKERSQGEVVSPLPGKVIEIKVNNGDSVPAGATLLVIESMKMEHLILTPSAGRVKEIKVSVGESVSAGKVLATID